MTRGEISKLVDMTVGHFPNTQGKDRLEIKKAWEESLGGLPYQQAYEALKRVLRSAKFWPTVAEILDAASVISEERQRQSFTPWKKSACPNCEGLGFIAIMQDGEERYARCPCPAGDTNYSGFPMAPHWAIVSDRTLVPGGEEVKNTIPF